MMDAGRRHLVIGLVQGLGERLPFADACFDFVTMGYALRHVPDLHQTFDEYFRVLRPGGRALLLEITKPQSPFAARLARLYFGSVVPGLAWIGTRSADAAGLMRFYWDTIAQCVTPRVVLASLERAGFTAERTVICGVFSEYVAARGPEGRRTNRGGRAG
jgi:demethylmenaquinone methyltransferase / 2-methoxy-6-polyprenyl-1,4-benzoquinol methylase